MNGELRGSIWIFGYGSLIFRPAFPFAERRAAFVEGYGRRFFQGSTDHRGVPGAPGRVVTLVAEPGARCWGAAYRISPEDRNDVVQRLDERERGGYERSSLTVVFGDVPSASVECLVYVATPENRSYLGAAPLPDIVEQIALSRGPSGSNLDYVLLLARALRELGAEDDPVFEIEEALAARRRES